MYNVVYIHRAQTLNPKLWLTLVVDARSVPALLDQDPPET